MGELWERGDVGVLLTPASGGRRQLFGLVPFLAWATGNFTRPVHVPTYLALLATHRDAARFLFATAPDVVGDWHRTWALSRDVLPAIRALGYPAAIVAQDGMAALPDPALWDCLFVGGTTEWKLSEPVYRLVREARALGKWTHMGRVNSWRRLRAAALSGYDSADGTCLAYHPPQYVREIARWLDRLKAQAALPSLLLVALLALTLAAPRPAAAEPAAEPAAAEPAAAVPAAAVPAAAESAAAESAAAVPAELLHEAAERFGLDTGALSRLIWCESGFAPQAVGGGGRYRGLGQWDRASWEEQAPRAGAPADWDAAFDPWWNAHVTAFALSEGQAWRWPVCRRVV
jgi:hypothetical protein